MKNKFTVDIYTPSGHYLSTDADYLSVTTGIGVVGILPNHAPLVSNIEVSKLTIRNDKEEFIYAVSTGFIHIKKDTEVVLIVDAIERSDEIDIERALASKQRAEERLQGSDLDVARAKASLLRALNRISIGKRE